MTFVKAIVTGALVFAIVLGIAIGGVEVWHLSHGGHPFDYKPFIAAGALILFPALALQKGDIGGAFTVVADNLPLARLGRRSTDPVVPVPTPEPKKGVQPAPVDKLGEEGP